MLVEGRLSCKPNWQMRADESFYDIDGWLGHLQHTPIQPVHSHLSIYILMHAIATIHIWQYVSFNYAIISRTLDGKCHSRASKWKIGSTTNRRRNNTRLHRTNKLIHTILARIHTRMHNNQQNAIGKQRQTASRNHRRTQKPIGCISSDKSTTRSRIDTHSSAMLTCTPFSAHVYSIRDYGAKCSSLTIKSLLCVCGMCMTISA